MGNYSLSVEAKADLAEIYKYGLTVLGQHVARNYIDALLKHFEEIAAKRLFEKSKIQNFRGLAPFVIALERAKIGNLDLTAQNTVQNF